MLQLREKDMPAAQLYRLAFKIVRLAEGYATSVLINERWDVALACGAHGVHLPSRSMPAEVVRRVTGHRLVIGVSTHSAREVQQAARQGADYVLWGPVFEPLSKRSLGPPLGLSALQGAVLKTSLPVIALGGITMANAESVLATGAAGVAAISLFWRSRDLTREVRRLKFGRRTLKKTGSTVNKLSGNAGLPRDGHGRCNPAIRRAWR